MVRASFWSFFQRVFRKSTFPVCALPYDMHLKHETSKICHVAMTYPCVDTFRSAAGAKMSEVGMKVQTVQKPPAFQPQIKHVPRLYSPSWAAVF